LGGLGIKAEGAIFSISSLSRVWEKSHILLGKGCVERKKAGNRLEQ
jgi:hypothetical protein